MNGARVEVTPGANPVSYAFRPPRRVRELAIGEQPCT
jgi:hypothetical protein